MDPRSIDPTECWVRHVRRGEQSDLSAIAVARVYLVRDDVVSGEDGLNGRHGWQTADVTAVLSDDGTFTLTLPNAAGDDGVLHRRRFRILTDDAYEPGEEWLEFWTSADPPDRPLFVGTPTDYRKTKSTVELSGRDLGVVLEGSITSDVDAWDAAGPADVLRHYSRLSVLAYGADLSDTATAGGTWSALRTVTPTGVAADTWRAAARLRWTSQSPAGGAMLALNAAGYSLQVDVSSGATTIYEGATVIATGRRQGLVTPGPVDLRIVAHYDRVFGFVAGELVVEFRRPSPWPALGAVTASVTNGTATLDGLHVETLAAFAARGPSASIERRVPGLPPATGLRGQYWNAAGIYAQNTTTDARLRRLWQLAGDDPVVDRVDPTLNFPTGTAGFPPNLPGAYAARWSGLVYLDLAAADRKLRLSGLVGSVRIYVGRTLRGDEAAAQWWGVAPGSSATLTTPALRGWIGEQAAGWYPIVVELAHDSAAAGIVLEDTALDGSGSPAGWATVPTSRLSPMGVYSDLLRLENHRGILTDVAQTFGYQWRVRYRSVESGEFPGALEAGSLIGRQTALEIDDDAVGSDAEVSGAAGDVVDGLLVDAAGIADPAGAGQLTAQVIDYDRAGGHLALRQSYESLSEISEPPLLATRADSLLALRGSPNEQVGVRPSGQRDLVDTFPLTGTLARMDWRPGDAARLRLDTVDVVDLTPRQMTSVAWSPRPDGLGPPTVGFRQRPRGPKTAMRRLTRAIYSPRRNYQGSVAIVTGSPGGATNTGAAVAGAADGYSRAPLPANLDDVVKVIAVVRALSGAGWRLEVTGADLGAPGGAVPSGGRYDVTRAAKAAGASSPQVYARLIGGTSGSYELTLEVWVRV